MICLACLSSALGEQQKQADKLPGQKLSENDRILHTLNRLGFGPRPEQFEQVTRMGLKNYIEQQLHPEQIDDSAVDAKLSTFRELQLSNSEIEAKYKDFVEADRDAAKLRQQLRRMEAQKMAAEQNSPPGTAPMQPAAPTSPAAPAGPATPPVVNPVAPAPTAGSIQQMVMADPDLNSQVQATRRLVTATAEPIALLHEEFSASKLIRATESKRQLQEVLVDFWSNHFNIDIRKAPCGVLKVLDDRDVIRPHIWGKFRDLLEASAKSPAMLVYLDNFQSVADQLPGQNFPRRRFLLNNPQQVKPVAPKRKIGLNENYAREIMELHTLGVNGGYTQQDVHEVARCFTGWSIGSPDGLRARINRYAEAGEFHFYPRVHDDGEKVVLGHRIPAGGGIQDGETVLDLLANDPATRKHISYELCQRLVSDEPPFSLVSKCIETWQHTDGDLRQIVRTIVTSPEFFSAASVRKKIKSPFEYAVSSVRALDGTLDPIAMVPRKQLPREANQMIRPPQGGGYMDLNVNSLLGQIGTMGQVLYQYQAPTGFPEDSRKWVSSGALISRLNFALALTQGKLKEIQLDNLGEDSGSPIDPNAVIDRLSNRILHGAVSPSTRSTLIGEASTAGTGSGPMLTAAQIAALLLGSPEFQRR